MYQSNTSARIYHSYSNHNKRTLVHILAVLPNPIDNREKGKLVIYRAWSSHKHRWYWYIEPIWVLDLWNKPPQN